MEIINLEKRRQYFKKKTEDRKLKIPVDKYGIPEVPEFCLDCYGDIYPGYIDENRNIQRLYYEDKLQGVHKGKRLVLYCNDCGRYIEIILESDKKRKHKNLH